MPDASLSGEIQRMARQAGAVAVGFAPADEVDQAHWSAFRRFIEQGRHFTMAWLENYPEIRRNPLKLFTPEATQGTVISLAFPYRHHDANPLFAAYAQGGDYHRVLRELLRPIARHITEATGARSRVCVDSAPILERYWAMRAGIGHIGLNHNLIVPGAGSYVLLAEIVTEAVLPSAAPTGESPCDSCRACLRACPHGALSADGTFDAALCQSCLTIEHRGQLEITLEGPAIYGCDLCLKACPANRTTAPGLPVFAPRDDIRTLTRQALAHLTPQEYTRIFADTAITRCPLPQLLRNLHSSK